MKSAIVLFIILFLASSGWAECVTNEPFSKANPLTLNKLNKNFVELCNQILLLKEEIRVIKRDVNTSLPRGTILPWYGTQKSVPNGWAICDGRNGTPDMRNRFLMGVESTDEIGVAGGSNFTTGKTRGHVLTGDEIPTHYHNIRGSLNGRELPWGPGTHPIPTSTIGKDRGSLWGAGNNQPHSHSIPRLDNRPQYIGVLFIIKLSDTLK